VGSILSLLAIITTCIAQIVSFGVSFCLFFHIEISLHLFFLVSGWNLNLHPCPLSFCNIICKTLHDDCSTRKQILLITAYFLIYHLNTRMVHLFIGALLTVSVLCNTCAAVHCYCFLCGSVVLNQLPDDKHNSEEI
jgi:hypothetical protein